jgi:hypothetical protein
MTESQIQETITLLSEALADANKFDTKSNDAAGKRLRATMQDAKNRLNSLRKQIQEERNRRKNTTPTQ